MRITIPLTAAALLLLAGCSAPTSDPVDTPADDPDGEVETPCVVGTWQLDVADYASQSEAYVLGLGIPIEGFTMEGAGTITFTDDGLVATDIALTTTGTIVAGETSVPLDQASTYSGSGDWAVGATPDTIDLANWANLPGPDAIDDPAAPVPAIDYTDIPTVGAACSADELVLQAPDAPLSARWTR